MTLFFQNAKLYIDPEQMAADYLRVYYGNQKITYPINPFQMLKDAGILFALKSFNKLEGVYIPAETPDDIATVGININRPIARQRFTAAHELCHHFRDSNRQIACPVGQKSALEVFADKFAAAVLMPIDELRKQVDQRKKRGYIDFDAVLDIANYFGVSFESCLYRIAYLVHAIEGNTEVSELRKRTRRYAPQSKRKEKGYTDLALYEGLIDAYADTLAFEPNEHARYVFQNHYIYNDSRMEGVEVDIDAAAEIVTDLRLKKQNSVYCDEENEAYLSIAGHYAMYQDILSLPVADSCSVFDSVGLNRKLFSCYPYPEFGGSFRQNDTLVLGAKFETVTHTQIFSEMLHADEELQELFANRNNITLSKYIEGVVQLHHRLTVIHPYADGNGRTLRALLNVMLIRAGVLPIYIKVEEKDEYVQALECADLYGNYVPLYEFMFKIILQRSVELCAG